MEDALGCYDSFGFISCCIEKSTLGQRSQIKFKKFNSKLPNSRQPYTIMYVNFNEAYKGSL